MKQFFRSYFSFNKRERNGILVLLIIILLLIIYLSISRNFYTQEKIDFSIFDKEVALLKEQENFVSKGFENNTIDYEKDFKLFEFNPNNLSVEQWKKLGLNEKQIKTIKNYESKGGKFYKKEDLKKIYGIPENLYLKLEPYVIFEDSIQQIDNRQKTINNEINKTLNTKPETRNILIELNTADSTQLTTIKGIGPFYAKAIIKKRNELGGYANINQLLEIWKFDEEKLNAIKNNFTIDISSVKKININTCTDKELKHPYLTWNMVNAIINFRKKHGIYKSVEEIKKTDLVDEETFRKIEPYLTIE